MYCAFTYYCMCACTCVHVCMSLCVSVSVDAHVHIYSVYNYIYTFQCKYKHTLITGICSHMLMNTYHTVSMWIYCSTICYHHRHHHYCVKNSWKRRHPTKFSNWLALLYICFCKHIAIFIMTAQFKLSKLKQYIFHFRYISPHFSADKACI